MKYNKWILNMYILNTIYMLYTEKSKYVNIEVFVRL